VATSLALCPSAFALSAYSLRIPTFETRTR
jgi:hypothetical protein